MTSGKLGTWEVGRLINMCSTTLNQLLENNSFLAWWDYLPSNLTGACTLTTMTSNAHFLSFHSDNSEDNFCNMQWDKKNFNIALAH
jgi:hypothetical protein